MTFIIKFNRLNIFITFTYNFKQINITINLLLDEQIIDRFDLIAKIFKLKLKTLIYDIQKKKMFDK